MTGSNDLLVNLFVKLLEKLHVTKSTPTAQNNVSNTVLTPIINPVASTTTVNPHILHVNGQPTQHIVPGQPTGQSTSVGPIGLLGTVTTLPYAFTATTLQDTTHMAWNMDTGDGHSIPVTNTGHSILPTPTKSLHLNNVLITPQIVKNLIYVHQFVRDNNCAIEFDVFGFSGKDFLTCRVLLRCDSTRDLYPVTAPSLIPHAFLVS
nr:ribonuclease H-like domain-containing protein [Tanacetum cinerariifolium]